MTVVQLCLILCDPWMVARQATLSMEFSRQVYGDESWTVKKAEHQRIDAFEV